MAKTGDSPKAKVAGMNTNVPVDLVPIVVAVTGHRDIPESDFAVLSASISVQLHDLSARYPASPCLLLSGLAEGADRLVARCALDAGWRVGAVLPLNQRDYELDFKDEQSVADFRELLSLSVWVRELDSHPDSRPQCYRVLGDWLASHAQVLIALWDGGAVNGPGGTAEVVRTFREGIASDRLILPDAGPVIHVQTRRSSNPTATPDQAIGCVQHLPACPGGIPGGEEESRWSAVLKRIDQFNFDVRRIPQSLRSSGIEKSKQTSLSDWNESSQSGTHSSVILARQLFLASDAMSMTAQKERDTLFMGLLAIGACAIFLAQVYSGIVSLPILLGCALCISAIGFAWNFVSEGRHLEQRYLDYRALAEACKVQFFWKIAGIQDCAADYYLREQRDELEWIRQAIQTTELGLMPGDNTPLETRLKFVRDSWIDDQLRYFLGDQSRPGGKAAFNRSKDLLWSRRSQRLLVGGMFLTLATVIFHGFIVDPASELHGWILKGMVVGYSLIFAAAALSKVYQENRAFSGHAKQYQRMGLTLQLARSRFDAALAVGDLAGAVSVVKSVGIDALAENGNWLLIHRERPVSAQGIG